MILNIHPSAADNFNKKASELVKLVKEIPVDQPRSISFHSELQASVSYNNENIISVIDVATTNYRGKVLQRFFKEKEKRFGLEKENYNKIVEIAEALQSLPALRTKLSRSFIEKKLFTWIKNKFQDKGFLETFTEYLKREAILSIKQKTSWIPIAFLEVEIPFFISNSQIHPISKNIIGQWEKKCSLIATEDKKNVSKLFEKIKKDFQGLSAIVTSVEAEPEHAFNYVIEEAQRITSILGVFSRATLIPDIKCFSRIKGSEYIARSTVFFELDDNKFEINNSMLDIPTPQYWRLSRRGIDEIKKMGLDKLSSFLAAESLKDFEQAVLNSILLYSKSAFTADPMEKVVHILSALESILLRNENEPIQQNLAERIAVFSTDELEDRKSIIKTIKSVYKIRSKYLHHGFNSSELNLLFYFMVRVRSFFIKLIKNTDHFNSKEEFIISIDDQKLS